MRGPSWKDKTPEEIRAYQRAYYQVHKEHKKSWLRQYRQRTCNKVTHKYEKTEKGFLMRKYRNMQSRVVGIQKKKAHLYKGLYLLPREVFYKWALGSPVFKQLFTAWKESNCDRKLCPTVDRIDPQQGYSLDNMEWVTHSENSRRGSKGGGVTNPKGINQYTKK